MNRTLQPIHMTTSHDIPIFLHELQYFIPIHIILCIYITTQNSLIIFHYHKDWKRISSLLFILIAATDIGNAFSGFGRSRFTLHCLSNRSVPWRFSYVAIYAFIIRFGQFSFILSAFLNFFLTVVKTINIVNPFYRLNKRAIYATLVMICFLYVTLLISDSFADYKEIGSNMFRCFNDLAGTFSIESLGRSTLEYVIADPDGENFYLVEYLEIVLLAVEVLLPCLTVLVCMILQMFYIRKAFSSSKNPALNNANHVNFTIFLISVLFATSVSFFSVIALTSHICSVSDLNVGCFSFPHLSYFFSKFTLPLLNAALFPTILILRKPDLKAEFKNYIMKTLLLPLTILYKLWSVVLRRSGSTEI